MEASRGVLALGDDDAGPVGPGHYQRHRPEQSLLYQVITQYYPAFLTQLAAEGRTLPKYVRREFEDYFKCGRLEHGFMRVRCAAVLVCQPTGRSR